MPLKNSWPSQKFIANYSQSSAIKSGLGMDSSGPKGQTEQKAQLFCEGPSRPASCGTARPA
ncbi:hypothetical protein SGRA_3741 [Saprospira grandis str. Lewin]|uniref:Uncharacterized protein n=1 Tax=Saprospira grandis (strain Lewin) TaxID=984262 RepID=H6L893_SAPGL|nr:hypothetical protein SGRA_3741 [Saprospira grandis str. Lewin]